MARKNCINYKCTFCGIDDEARDILTWVGRRKASVNDVVRDVYSEEFTCRDVAKTYVVDSMLGSTLRVYTLCT